MNGLIKRVSDKYSTMSEQIKISFWFTISNIISNGISYLTLPVFTRLLSTEEYGQVSIFNSWNTIIMVLVTFNLSSGVFMTGYVKFKGKEDRLISSFQGLVTTIAGVYSVIFVIFRKNLENYLELETWMMLLMILECVLSSSYNMWAMKLKFNCRYKMLVAIALLTSVCNPVLGVILICSFKDGAAAKIISSVAVQLVLTGWIYFNNIVKGRCYFNLKFWNYALMFGIPLIPHYLSLVVLNQSDRLMIASLCGKSQSGIYSIGYSISMLINLVISGLNTAFGPWIIQKLHNKQYEEIKCRTNQILTFVLVMALGIISIEPELIKIVTTKDYYGAMIVMPPITIGLFFSYLNNTFARVEFYYEKKYYIAAFSVFAALLNIVLNRALIPVFGYIAAGYTTLVSYIVLGILHYIAYRIIADHEMNGEKVYDLTYIVFLSATAIVISFVMTLLIDLWMIRYLIIIILLIMVIKNRNKLVNIMRRI